MVKWREDYLPAGNQERCRARSARANRELGGRSAVAGSGARHAAALVLIVEPGRQHRVNPDLVATTLELPPAETQVAVRLVLSLAEFG